MVIIWVMKIFFLYSSVYSCHFWISSASVRSMPFLSFIVLILAWNVPLISLIFLKRSLVFPILLFLCTDHRRRLSYLFLLFFGTLHSDQFIFPFILCPLILFFSQLFVKPPQTTILPSCISFSLEWFWSLPSVQCFYIYLFIVMESVPSFPHFIHFLKIYQYVLINLFFFSLFYSVYFDVKLSQSWP